MQLLNTFKSKANQERAHQHRNGGSMHHQFSKGTFEELLFSYGIYPLSHREDERGNQLVPRDFATGSIVQGHIGRTVVTAMPCSIPQPYQHPSGIITIPLFKEDKIASK